MLTFNTSLIPYTLLINQRFFSFGRTISILSRASTKFLFSSKVDSILFSFSLTSFLTMSSRRQKHRLALARELTIDFPQDLFLRQFQISVGNLSLLRWPQMSLLLLKSSPRGNISLLRVNRLQSGFIKWKRMFQKLIKERLFRSLKQNNKHKHKTDKKKDSQNKRNKEYKRKGVTKNEQRQHIIIRQMILKSLVKNIRSNIYKTLIIRMELTGKKEMAKNKKLLDDLIKRRYVYFQGFEIYGGCAGLYDFGPVGCAIKNNIQQLWREFFVLEEDMLEINCTCITPHVVLQHSGHVAKFADVLVKDVKTGQGYRADKIITEVLENKLEKGKLSEQEKHEIKKIIINIDAYTKEELHQIIQKYKIKATQTGNDLSEPLPFNLMFKTEIGPSTNLVGYLRPETAQGMFVNFNKLSDYNGGRLPFAAAQIGLGFRNQIAPRNALLRVRQFQMAEIEHFVDPLDKSHKKFKNVAHIKLPLYSREIQQNMGDPEWVSIGDAVEKKIVDNQTLGYFLVRIFLFLKDVGLDTENYVRFRQHLKDEMAHYACDCWDAEALTGAGWIEIVGCADRSAYDLTHHSLGSGTKLVASRKFKEARPELQTTVVFDRKVIGKEFKKDSQAIISHLENATQEQKSELKKKFEADLYISVNSNGTDFKLTKEHVNFEQKIVNVMQEKYTPSVIEPSFGLGRIMSCMLEHTFRMRDEKRTYLVLKPRIAPVKVSILPLQNDARFGDIIHELKVKMKRCLLTCKVDDTGQSIGKRYSRTDEIGIPFAITVDYTTLEDQTITLRELHTMRQIRVPMGDLQKVMTNLSNQLTTWDEVCKNYPEHKTEEKDEKDN